MAILPYLPGLEATVLIEDSPCAEIQCSDDAGEPAQNKVVQYIQSEAGSRFSVKLRVTPQYPHKEYDVVVETYIDGYKVDSTILLRERELGIGLSTGFAFCIRGSRSYTGTEVQLRGFRFANLLINDRTLNVSDSEVVEKVRDLGDITLKLYRAKEISSGNLLKHAFVFNELSDVPEKALKGKALSQRTVLDAPKRIPLGRQSRSQRIDPPDSPFAMFSFRYRSLDDLKAMLIVPRSPSPTPLEDRPEEELTPAELRELLQRERAQNANIKQENAKRQRSSTVTDHNVQPSRKRRGNEEVEVIDLT